ncbi:DUF3800 domain-containing protein [Xanthobacter versatilis]|uniref:DUF3800 domain-containing protein n=1 Tax=Xanthobacter autotrophicus (strain ATCC BAA-1158 / Py2) TaxID=78245 RepID=UPI003728A2B9
MFYFVDESGNTGLNLFDANQPILYYGVLGARSNLDIVAQPLLEGLRKELGVKRIHANELGVAKLTTVANRVIGFSKKNDLRFSAFTVNKIDHAVITYFDQIFDAGLNEAVAWHHYWTPLRYPLLFKVAHLFDAEIAKEAWRARCEQNPARCTEMLKGVHQKLLAKLHTLPDARSREILEGAIKWADANPEAISFGSSNHESTLQISPNLIGFQSVLQGIAIHASAMKRTVRRITVDRQTQFNGAQAELAEIYQKLRGHKTGMGPGMPKFDYSILPEVPPEFKPGDESAGLELVDISLWTAKRLREGKPLSPELKGLLWIQARRGITDEVSLAALNSRWRFLLDLPQPDLDTPLPKDMQEMFDDMEKRRREAVAGL